MKDLTGTTKQVEWANAIRRDVIALINAQVSEFEGFFAETQSKGWAECIASGNLAVAIAEIIPSAEWWIEFYGRNRPTGKRAIGDMFDIAQHTYQTVIPWPEIEAVFAAHGQKLERGVWIAI